ncbi:MAG: Uma2 family endonuclease [Cyanobacteria bacterium Co-bin13]|nr:Uma2 family endonuclease [Cyanobacteria bacterium Co-bin13]
MVTTPARLNVAWEKLPDDFVLDDDPVDNINQPALTAALTESLELAGRLPETAIATTNYGICATVNGRIVVKAPDWGYVPQIRVPREDVKRSYTPRLQGEMLSIVMEFLSDTEGSEYSSKPTHPLGKWFFYERVLAVPNYAIFEPDSGTLELYRLDQAGLYALQTPALDNRYWLPEMSLFLGTWQGQRENRTGCWLRWWDEAGSLLPWGFEKAEQERQRAEQERQRADRLAEQLRALGVDPEQV